MDQDRNLLFGVLAAQLGKIEPGELGEVAARWAGEPGRCLAEMLVEDGLISALDRQLIEALSERAVEVHAGDVSATIGSLGGDPTVTRTFCGAVQREAQGTLTVRLPRASVAERPREHRPSATLAVDEVPGRYRQAREHERGGMGRILLVHDEHIGRQIALKELLPSSGPSIDVGSDSPVRRAVPMMARFLQEARITGQLEHPSIVPVYELGRRADGTYYYTMKLVRGESLSSALRRRRSLADRLELLPHFVDLCQAIAYAHSRGVIHRDIKPGNVMIGQFGETVVIDWGLAKARGADDIHAQELEQASLVLKLGRESDLARTSFGDAVGTPSYMPPEQASWLIDEIDERSDVYSLGAVLYELLTGKPPFQGSSVQEVLKRVISQEPQSTAEVVPDAPPELAAICRRAMSKDAPARYQTAGELAEDVQRFLSGALVAAHQYGFTEHLRRFVTRYRALVTTVAAAVTVVIIVLAVSAAWNLRERRRAERQAETTREVLDFLVGLFDALDPAQARGDTITAREILDSGAAQLDRELADEPLVRARLMDTMGKLYLTLGLLDRAEPLLRSALETREGLLGEDHHEVAESLHALAQVLAAAGEYSRAEDLERRCVAMRESLFGPTHALVAESLAGLAELLRSQGEYSEAATVHRRAFEMRERLLGRDHPQVAVSLNALGVLNHQLGEYAEAEDNLRRSLAISEQALGPDHPKVAATLHNLANLATEQGRFDQAKALFERSLAIREKVLGANHPSVATTLSSLGRLHAARGQLDIAERQLQRSLEIWQASLGGDHPNLAASLDALAMVYCVQGELDSAEPLLERSLSIREGALGPEHSEVAASLNNLASLYLAQERFAEAEPLLERSVRLMENALGGDHPSVALGLASLADLYRDTGRYGEAEPLYRRALAIQEQALGQDHPEVATTLEALGVMLRAAARPDDAAPLEARAAAIRQGRAE